LRLAQSMYVSISRKHTALLLHTLRHCLIFTRMTTFASAAAISAAASSAASSAAALASASAFAFSSAVAFACAARAAAFEMPPQVSHEVSYPTVGFREMETGIFRQASQFCKLHHIVLYP
jgi:hypothetical protein